VVESIPITNVCAPLQTRSDHNPAHC
jgi:hypothetical protein